jgi:hypothetical protein
MEFHLPGEVTEHINAYIPKDKDMFSPTAAIVKQAIKESEREFIQELLSSAITHDVIELSTYSTESGDFRVCLNLSLVTEMLPSNFIAIQ